MGTDGVGLLRRAGLWAVGDAEHDHAPHARGDGRPGLPGVHGLADDPGSTSFILTAIALAIVIVGVLVVSNAWKTPTYNVILGWDPEALPADWEAVRERYFLINWIQLATTWVVFALLLVALISL
jgi:hypothetical protein